MAGNRLCRDREPGELVLHLSGVQSVAKMQTHPSISTTGAAGPKPARLQLSSRERAGLAWVRGWSRQQLTHLKVERKYRPREAVFEAEEVAMLQSLLDLERAAGRLLAVGEEQGGQGNTFETV